MEIAFVLLAVAVPLWLNVIATRAVLSDDLSERGQKFWQLLLVWLIPLIGSLIVLAVHRPEEAPARRYRDRPDPGDDSGMSGRSARGVSEAVDGD
jgi:hypothetical protein